MSDPTVANRLAGLSREQRALLFEQLRKRKEQQAAAAPDRLTPRAPAAAPPPASFAQERLWLIDRLQPGLALYNMPLALRIAGEARPAVLAAALGEIVRRHETLRTTFREAEGRPVQAIAPPGPWELPLVDLSGLPAGVRDGLAQGLAQEESTRPFDLARGPLLRAALLRLAPAEHVLLLDMHHIVSDGWSLGVLVHEMTALYGAALAGAPSPLPELAVQYADFAVWQRGWLQGERLERQLAYWRERLAGVPAGLDLPADRPLPAVRTHAGDQVRVPFGADLQRDLARLARQHEATPFMVLLAGFQILLARLTGAADLTVGTPIANRGRSEIEPLIGFFVNTLVLRSDLAGDPSFGDLLARVRKSTLEAYAHQDLPFERLVEALRPERHLAMTPLFQVLFAVQNAPIGVVDLPGLSLSPVPFERGLSLFELELSFWEFGDQMDAEITYSAERFDPATVRRLGAHLETLLRGLLADPGRRISTVPLLSTAERHQLTAEWNDTAAAYPQEASIPALFAEQAARRPDAPALLGPEPGAVLTYRELDERSAALAGELARRGVGRGYLVGIFAERSPELVIALLAVLRAGGAYLPLDPAYPRERLALMLADAGDPLVLAQPGLADRLPAPARTLPLQVPGVPGVPGAPAVPLSGGDLAYVLYTSGSTGTPKGVAVSHRSVARLVRDTGYAAFGPDEVFLLMAPVSFDASTFELWGPLLNGGRLAILPPGEVSLDGLERSVGDFGVTTLWLTAGLFHLVVDERLGALAPLRQLLAGGDVVSPAHAARVRRELPGL
ncbi:MAG TPA: condensation domain-containing protein, partial [Thermoanaerobaculia bacterium]